MLTYTYISKGKFGLVEKPKPTIQHERDAIVRVTLASICSSDLHIKHGSVPRAVEGITGGHEMVGIVEEVGAAVTHVAPGDRVTVNVETFCGECFFCKKSAFCGLTKITTYPAHQSEGLADSPFPLTSPTHAGLYSALYLMLCRIIILAIDMP